MVQHRTYRCLKFPVIWVFGIISKGVDFFTFRVTIFTIVFRYFEILCIWYFQLYRYFLNLVLRTRFAVFLIVCVRSE